MKSFSTTIVSSLALFGLVALGAPSPKSGVLQHDRALALLHHVNAVEIDLGNVARTKGQSAEVRAYGEMLACHHEQADALVGQTAAQDRVALLDWKACTAQEQQQASDEKALVARLLELRGAEFDKAFLKGMVEAHQAVIGWLEEHRTDLQGTHTAILVEKLLPQLKKHRDLAAQLLKSCGEN